MQSSAKKQGGHPARRLEGKLSGWGDVAPIKNQRISSDSPACTNIARKHATVTPVHFQEPVPISNRISPLCTEDEVSDKVNVDNTIH